MELPINTRTFDRALDTVERLLAKRRVVAVMGDRLTLCSFALAGSIRGSLVGVATTEDDGFELVMSRRPNLLIVLVQETPEGCRKRWIALPMG